MPATPVPPPYTRQTSFTDWEANHPSEPAPGTSLDAEFNAVQVSLTDTQARLAQIQRDDGSLANESVGRDQLDPELSAALTGGFYPRGAWQANTRYKVGDAVNQDGTMWAAVVDHVSGTSFSVDMSAGKWMFISQVATAPAIPITPIPPLSATTVQGALEALNANGLVLSAFDANLGDTADPAKGAGMVGWGRSLLSEAINDAGDVFNSRNVDVREFFPLVVRPNPLDATTWDWSAAAQAAIDMAETLNLVAVMANAEMRLSAPLQMGSRSRLYLPAGCTLLKDFEGIDTYTGTIRSKGDGVAQDDIVIFGHGAIKAKATAGPYGGRVGKHLVFFNCTNLRVLNIRILNTYNDWTTKFQNCSNVLIDGISIDVGSTAVLTDGIHFKGKCRYLVIANCRIRTGDDCIAFTQEVAVVDDLGDIEDVVVANCSLDTSQSSLIKIHVRPETTTRVRRVNITNIVGKVGRINAGGFSFYFTDDGLTQRVADIKVSNITGHCIENGDYCARIVGCRDIQIDKFTAYEALRGFLVEDSAYVNVSDLRVHPLRGTGGQVSSGLILQNVDWFSIENPRVSGTGQHGVQLGASGKPARYGSVRGGTLYGCVSTGLRLTNADGCAIDGVTCYGNNNGIVEDAGSVNNRLTNNDVRFNTTVALSVTGASTRINQNVGYVGAAQGSATVASGATSVEVTHGLATTPSLNGIKAHLINSGGNAAKYWVSANTATQFTINVNVDPGATTAIFGWTAKITAEN